MNEKYVGLQSLNFFFSKAGKFNNLIDRFVFL